MPKSSTPSLPPATGYTPPPELVQAAEDSLAGATPAELARAERAYVAYQRPTAGRSAMTGAELPTFDKCSTLVRAGWLATARELRSSTEEEQARARLAEVANAMNRDIAEAQQKLDALHQEASQRSGPSRVEDIPLREGKALFDWVLVVLDPATGTDGADGSSLAVVGLRMEADGHLHTYVLALVDIQTAEPSGLAQFAVDAVHEWKHMAPSGKAVILTNSNTGGALVTKAIRLVDATVKVKSDFTPEEAEEGHVDPFLMGIREIAGAARDLAEAQQRGQGAVAALVDTTAQALHERVKALAPTPPES